MAKTIAFFNQKGGVGKTTLLFHFANYLAENGHKVLVADIDPQEDSSTVLIGESLVESEGFASSGWLLGATESQSETPKVFTNENGIGVIYADHQLYNVEERDLSSVIGAVKNNLSLVVDDYDYVLFDCPPTIGKRVIAALYVTDHIFSPIEPRKFSIDGIASLMNAVISIREDKPGLVFEGMVINRVNSRSVRQKDNIKAIRNALGKQVLLAELVEREPISDAVELRAPVWKLKKTGAVREASREMNALMKEILWRVSE
jgi:chromosome partitioning protein